MSTLYNAHEHECRYCGKNFQPGDDLVEVWDDAKVDENGDWQGQDVDIYHAQCMKVVDDRPPKYRLKSTPRTGTVHLVRPNGRAFCRAIDPEDSGELETIRTDNPERDVEGVCQTCARMARKERHR